MATRQSKAAGNQRGMTVLEVIVSLVVAGAFLSATLPAIAQSYSRLKYAELQTKAVQLAASVAEDLSDDTSAFRAQRDGKEDGLTWHVDTSKGDVSNGQAIKGRPALLKHRISVSHGADEPLVSVEVFQIHTEQ